MFSCRPRGEPAAPRIPATNEEGYIDVPGGRVWYRSVGDGSGVPLLCLHGGPGFPHDYLEELEGLTDRRRVIFYDQLGCGRSDRPHDKSLWEVDRFVEEVAIVRESLGLGGDFMRAANRIGSRPDEAIARLRAAEQALAAGDAIRAHDQLTHALAFVGRVGAQAHMRDAETLASASRSRPRLRH